MADPIGAFGYDETVRNTSDQISALEALRGRAGTLLSTAALASSFLGGLTLVAPAISEAGEFRGARIGGWAWAAIVAFGIVALLTFAILWPWTWRFKMNPVFFVTEAKNANLELDGLKWQLAEYHEQNWKENDMRLKWLYRAFQAGVIVLVAEVVFWILELRR
jgi:MFS family permease